MNITKANILRFCYLRERSEKVMLLAFQIMAEDKKINPRYMKRFQTITHNLIKKGYLSHQDGKYLTVKNGYYPEIAQASSVASV